MLFLWGNLSAQDIIISNPDEMVPIGNHISFLEDNAATLTIQDIISIDYQKKFQKYNKEIFHQLASNSAIWIRFEVQNLTNQDIWLEIGDSFNTWEADFYAPNGQGNYSKPNLLGSLRKGKNNEFPSNYICAFLVQGENQKNQVFYLKLKSGIPKSHYFQIGTTFALYEHGRTQNIITIIFIGFIISIIAYKSFLYIITRDIIYLLFLGYLLSSIFITTFVSGYSFTDNPWFWNKIPVWFATTYIFITIFTTKYLELKQTSKFFFYWIWGLTFIICIIFPALSLFEIFTPATLANPYQVLILLFLISILSCCLYLVSKSIKKARFFTLAWIFNITGTCIFLLAINGVLDFNIFTQNGVNIGIMLQSLMFAMALGNRLNTLKLEKESAQAETLSLIQNQKVLLEKEVHEKTAQLQEAFEQVQAKITELQTNNEELRQTQEELQTQRDFVEKQNKELQKYNQKLQGSEQVLRKMNDSIQEKNKELEFFNQKISSSINSAKTIQEALLPTQEKLDRTLGEYFLIYQPKDIVSGDFYWTTIEQNYIFLVAADCTGHGVPGALMANMGMMFLYSIIKQNKIYNPCDILEKLHQEVSVALKQEKTTNNSGMDVTILRIENVNNQKSKKIIFSGAKHNILYFDIQKKSISELKGTRKSIGGFQNVQKKFETHEFDLHAGDLIYLGSDGLEDQNNTKRKKFGRTKIKSIIQENYHLPLQQQREKFEQALQQHMEGELQRDDILWMGLKV